MTQTLRSPCVFSTSEPLAPPALRVSALQSAAHVITQGLFKLGLLAEDDIVEGSAPPAVTTSSTDATTAEQVVVTNPLSPNGAIAPPPPLLSQHATALAQLRPQGSSAGSARELSRATAVRRELAAFRSMGARSMRSLHSRSLQQRGGSSVVSLSGGASPRSPTSFLELSSSTSSDAEPAQSHFPPFSPPALVSPSPSWAVQEYAADAASATPQDAGRAASFHHFQGLLEILLRASTPQPPSTPLSSSQLLGASARDEIRASMQVLNRGAAHRAS